jgi:glycosyl transferase family 87
MSTVADAHAFPAPITVAGVVWTPTRLRALRHGLWFAAGLYCIAAIGWALDGMAGVDAHAYWSSWRNGLYSAGPEQRDAYLYSPVFAQVLWPLTLLPWPVFYGLWMAAAAATYVWLLAPLGPKWAIPLLLICVPEIEAGNVWPFFALVLVLGFRFSSAWAFPVLLKVTPGVGVLWFAARREWRRAASPLIAALAIAGLSFALSPGLWADWVRLLAHPGDFTNPARETLTPLLHFPALVRLAVGLPLSAALTIYAARKNRPRLLPLAMFFASPVTGLNALALMTAIPRLGQAETGHTATSRSAP